MPTPFSGAAASDATAVPWYSFGPSTVWSLRKLVFGRPANSGCVGSTPPVDDRYRNARSRRRRLVGTDVRQPPFLRLQRVAGDAARRRGSRAARAERRGERYEQAAAHVVSEGSDTLARCPAPTSPSARTSATGSGRCSTPSRSCAPAPGVEIAAVSGLIETEPVGFVDQPRFVNGVVALDTTLPARALLELLLDVERRFGRSREGVPDQGPRTLDLDLLLYGDAVIDEPGLQVPHPRLHERSFVLEPLAELAPGLQIPGHGDVQALIARVH